MHKWNELAVADAYKAWLLSTNRGRDTIREHARFRDLPRLHSSSRTQEFNALDVLIEALVSLHDHEAALHFYRMLPLDRKKNFAPEYKLYLQATTKDRKLVPGSREEFGEDFMDVDDEELDDAKALDPAGVIRHRYPWIDYVRSDALGRARARLTPLDLALRPGSLAPSGTTDMLGVFATKAFKKGATILVERIWNKLIPKGYGGRNASGLLHDHIQGNQYRNIPKLELTTPQAELLAQHDARNWARSALTIIFTTPPTNFDFQKQIVEVSSTLMRTGQLFDPSMEFYRLWTLSWMWDTNCCAGVVASEKDDGDETMESDADEDKKEFVALSRLFSYFNHSCDPNADWDLRGDGEINTVTARRDIAEGEEINISYVPL